MNKLLLRSLFAASLCLVATAVRAADTSPIKSVQFKDGKVTLVREDGQRQLATNDVALPENIKVMTNGTFAVGSGKSRKLKDGQSLGADGNLTSADGSVVPVGDHIVMQGGRLMVVRDGDRTPATGEVRLGDGSRVKPDGTIAGADGRLHRMLDGQISKFSGASIPSTDTVTVKNGQVVLQKDGGRVTLKRGQTMMMSDGSKVYSDGTVTRPDGTKTKVAEGGLLKLPGVSPAKR